jgi:hypothetical protein
MKGKAKPKIQEESTKNEDYEISPTLVKYYDN